MKPTSVVFIVISAILIVVGVILCIIGGVIAGNRGVELYADYIDDAGNAVVEYDLTGKKASGLAIDLDEAEVYIVGNADRTYLKVENYPTKAYDYWMSEGTVNVCGADVLSVFRSFRISESGFGFNGLRHYLALGKYKDKVGRITLYLASGSKLNSVDITLKKGSVRISDTDIIAECMVCVDEGDITFKNVSSPGKVKAICGTGDITFSRCNVISTNTEVTEKGNILCDIDLQYSFTLKCVSGGVYLDSARSGSDYSGVYPSGTASDTEVPEGEETDSPAPGTDPGTEEAPDGEGGEDDERPDQEFRIFVGRVKLGDIRIKTIGA